MFIAIIGFVLTIVLSLRGTARALTVINLLIIPITVLAVSWRHRGFYHIFKSTKNIVFITFSVTLFLSISPDLLNRFEIISSFQATLYRLTGLVEWTGTQEMKAGLLNQINSEIDISRGAEARDFIKSLNWFEYIFGKGFGTLWYSEFWGQYWPIVHSGPFHLIFRGGFILLIICYSILFSAIKISWRNSKTNAVAMGCFVYLITWSAKFISYGADESSYYLYVFWLIIGLAFSTEIDRKLNTFSTSQ